MPTIATFAAIALVMGAGDYLWLGVIARRFVRGEVGELMLDTPRWIPALLFYAMYVLALWVFAVSPTLDGDWKRATLYGALFGLFAYATYDLTNLATLKGWTLAMTVADIAWGTLLSAAAASAGALTARYLA